MQTRHRAMRPTLRTAAVLLAVLLAALLAAGCGDDGGERTEGETTTAGQTGQTGQSGETGTAGGGPAGEASGRLAATETYRADLTALNADVVGRSPHGTATLTVYGDSLLIEVEMQNTPPGIMHLQHTHGMPGGGDATCVGADQDANGDGVVDLLETTDVSGTTLIPFHADPAGLQIQAQSYPVADAEGRYRYRRQVALRPLRAALREQHGIQSLDFTGMVVYVHGVPEQTGLPETVQSLPEVPAHVTLPIACGALERAGDGGRG